MYSCDAAEGKAFAGEKDPKCQKAKAAVISLAFPSSFKCKLDMYWQKATAREGNNMVYPYSGTIIN